jgi:colicin import membrane protein
MRDLALKRPEPGKWQSAALAAGMHLLLGLFLFYSVRWQTSKPEAVQVELVSSMPVVQAPAPPPPPEPEVRKAPEPVVEPPAAAAAQAGHHLQGTSEAETGSQGGAEARSRSRRSPSRRSRRSPTRSPHRRTRGAKSKSQEKNVQGSAGAESAQQTQREASREADLLAQAAVEGARRNATNSWTGKISAKIRGNIVLPPGASGNPEAMFAISLLPDGSVVGEPKLRRSTGNPALDDAILRAIVKSSPLPKPDDPSVFVRNLDLVFRPLEQ